MYIQYYSSTALFVLVLDRTCYLTRVSLPPPGVPKSSVDSHNLSFIYVFISLSNRISPIGIFFLILGKILAMDDWVKVFSQIGLYSITVISGLLIHGLLVLPLIFLIFTRRNPVTYIKGVSPALMTAFATASR